MPLSAAAQWRIASQVGESQSPMNGRRAEAFSAAAEPFSPPAPESS